MSESKQRVAFWDNYKGILIFLVVFAHYLYDYAVEYDTSRVDQLVSFIYAFHMPAFVFCSGCLSQSPRTRSKKAIAKLTLYYLVFNTLMIGVMVFRSGAKISLLTPKYSFWYLLSLIA